MSELRETKRVRRIELYTSFSLSRSTSPDLGLQARFHAQLDQLYGGIPNADFGNGNGDNNSTFSGSADERREDGFEFRLFALSTKKGALGELNDVAQKVDVRSPTPVKTEPGFIRPHRFDTYYFTNKVSAEKKKEYERAAVSGQDIRRGLEARWPGLELPWRVVTIKPNTYISAGLCTFDAKRLDKRRRIGKKRRIVLRKRLVLERAKRETESKRKLDREEAESEKRTRRNREKKVKRKEKEKAKRALRVDKPG